ncbi:MAG: hypothetical protein EON90_15210 [Brevundimonas sp.]|nr:MAG: hypothetical protein EON90_15210 [Brevundimonas sp.]
MAKLKVPSAQHLARNWLDTSAKVQKGLVDLVKNPPTFSYIALFGFVRDMLLFGVPREQIEHAIRTKVKREDVRGYYLELLPLIADHFADEVPTFVMGVDRRYYAAGRGLMVPFDPPIVYGTREGMVFPWFSFWKSNPLSDERLSLFVTMIREVLAEDPDLEAADFQILDFSAPKGSKIRELKVIHASDIPSLTEARKIEMLEIFAEGYFAAEMELGAEPSVADEKEAPSDPDQPGLFD